MLLWELPVGVFIILLFIAFFQWRKKVWDRQEREKEQKALNLYLHLNKFSFEDQAYILNHSKPFYLRGHFKRLYYYACRRWDESGSIYDNVEEIIRSSWKSRRLRRKALARKLWRKVLPSKSVAIA
jgi:hypothetical protein